MGYEFTTIDGCRVEKRVAEDFERMAAAFKKQFGLELKIRSGVRTREEQQALYERFINGHGNQAAKPDGSRHQIENKIGPRALDLYDTGKDAGVKFAGSVRSNWLKKNAPRFNFTCAGLAGWWVGRKEPWHYEWLGNFQEEKVETPASKPSTGMAASALPNKYGLENVVGLQKISNRYTTGKKTEIDNRWGDLSQAGFDTFLDKEYGDHLDKGLAAWLRKKYGYVGDDTYGPKMKAALERANEANKNT